MMNTTRVSKLILVILLFALVLGVTAVAAQGSSGAERLGTARLVRGEAYIPPAFEKPLDLQPNAPKPAPAAAPTLKVDGPAAYAPQPFPTILNETFEGVWPTGLWSTFDNNGSFGGTICWNDESWIAYSGSWSGWPAGGCADGLDPNFDLYANNMDSWATYGPFSLAGRKKANLSFRFWNESEVDFDFFYWCASPNGVDYYCKSRSGDSNGWINVKLNLKKVPGYGSFLGDSSVWIAFVFQTDGSVVDDGPFVDNVKLVVK
jgi:hypothetical protein